MAAVERRGRVEAGICGRVEAGAEVGWRAGRWVEVVGGW